MTDTHTASAYTNQASVQAGLVMERTLHPVRSELHLRESQRVTPAGPVGPPNAVRRDVFTSLMIEPVGRAPGTCAVPPTSMAVKCTWRWSRVVIAVESTEHLSDTEECQWITFRQQTVQFIIHMCVRVWKQNSENLHNKLYRYTDKNVSCLMLNKQQQHSIKTKRKDNLCYSTKKQSQMHECITEKYFCCCVYTLQ